ncbi:MAG: hypothetical protein QNJ74_18165 [Trichodesmium sp. MO_231.B1]|nr:hypothetical protein [Trichodesmium sp. MO_231.B1]
MAIKQRHKFSDRFLSLALSKLVVIIFLHQTKNKIAIDIIFIIGE